LPSCCSKTSLLPLFTVGRPCKDPYLSWWEHDEFLVDAHHAPKVCGTNLRAVVVALGRAVNARAIVARAITARAIVTQAITARAIVARAITARAIVTQATTSVVSGGARTLIVGLLSIVRSFGLDHRNIYNPSHQTIC
jgi:hypothetical protein